MKSQGTMCFKYKKPKRCVFIITVTITEQYLWFLFYPHPVIKFYLLEENNWITNIEKKFSKGLEHFSENTHNLVFRATYRILCHSYAIFIGLSTDK